MQTLPEPHCELNWQASLGGTQEPATQTSVPVHGCVASHPQLAPVQLGFSHWQRPFTQIVPAVAQSAATLQVPGTGVGVGSAGETHWFAMQTVPCGQSVEEVVSVHCATQPALVHFWPVAHW
jgi:hypothetical protein